MQLSGLSSSLQTKRLLIQFPGRAHAWVARQVPIWGRVRGNQLMFVPHTDVSLPFSLPSPLSQKKSNNVQIEKKVNCLENVII